MTEYIDKKKFQSFLERKSETECVGCGEIDCLACVEQWLGEICAADVVEVVRCRDCVHRRTDDCSMYIRCDCGAQHSWETANDFCSWGEGKEKSNG